MTFNTFVVEDFHELLALQRVFREAKFCFDPSDEEISTSPIVASLAQRLMSALIAADVARTGTAQQASWDHWLALDASREEWAVALKRAAKDADWKVRTLQQKQQYVETLLSPFLMTAENLSKFIAARDALEPASVIAKALPV